MHVAVGTRPRVLANSVTTPRELAKSSAEGRMHMQATAILLLQLLLPPASSSWHSCSCCCCYWLLQVLLLPLLLLLSNQSASKSQTLTYNPIHGFKLTYLPAPTTAPGSLTASQPQSRRQWRRFRVPGSGFGIRTASCCISDLDSHTPSSSPLSGIKLGDSPNY